MLELFVKCSLTKYTDIHSEHRFGHNDKFPLYQWSGINYFDYDYHYLLTAVATGLAETATRPAEESAGLIDDTSTVATLFWS